MDFDSPDVMKDFPGLYASELNKKCTNDSDYSDDNEKGVKKDILIGKRKDKKDKERGYAALEGESSADEQLCKSRSPSKSKKTKSFKFTTKAKEKREKSREKDITDRKKDRDKKLDKEKGKSEKSKKLKQSVDELVDIAEALPIFGVSLEISVDRSRCHDGIDIPLPIRDCIDFIESTGITFEGLFKVSGAKSKVLHLRKMYNQREIVHLSDYDPPTITSLLKSFLRDLPEPIFTNDLLIRFEEAGAILNANTREKHLKILIDNLPSLNKLLLSWLIVHLNNVSLNEKLNKMNKQSLATALNHTFHCTSRLLNILLSHCLTLFPHTKILPYIPPLCSGTELPKQPDSIAIELNKQESLLNQIHKEMNAGCISKQREELLWEVQRIITQLKRTLKNANKDIINNRECAAAKKSLLSTIDDKAAVADSSTIVVNQGMNQQQQGDVKKQVEITPPPVPVEAVLSLPKQRGIVVSSDLTDGPRNLINNNHNSSIIKTAKENLIIVDNKINNDNDNHDDNNINDVDDENIVVEKDIVDDNDDDDGLVIKTSELSDDMLFLMQYKNNALQDLKESLLHDIEVTRGEIVQLKGQMVVAADSNNKRQQAAIPHENLDEIMTLLLKENQILQIKKINLVRQIIEQQELCIDLKAKLLIQE